MQYECKYREPIPLAHNFFLMWHGRDRVRAVRIARVQLRGRGRR